MRATKLLRGRNASPSYLALFKGGIQSLWDGGVSSLLNLRTSAGIRKVQEEADAHKHFLYLSVHSGDVDVHGDDGDAKSPEAMAASLMGMSANAVIRSSMALAATQVEEQLSVFRDADEELATTVGEPSLQLRVGQLAKSANEALGWTIERGTSLVRDGGSGVFARGDIPLGAVAAFYPGVVYTPRHHQAMPNYPDITEDNPYLIMRYDRSIVDGKSSTAHGGPYASLAQPASVQLDSADCAYTPRGVDTSGWEMNPHALGHLVNHPPKSSKPNVMGMAFNFDAGLPARLHPYVPNRYAAAPGVIDLDWMIRPLVRGYLLIAIDEIADGEELYLDYRLHPQAPRPEWYEPVDEEANRRRWGITDV